MIEQVHKHICDELHQNTRTDTIFILAAILLNLIALAVNSGMAGESREKPALLAAMLLFVGLVLVINIVVVLGLRKGRETRSTLIKGLIKMYQDKGVSEYYDASLLRNYRARYQLFILVVVGTGLLAIILPFVIR